MKPRTSDIWKRIGISFASAIAAAIIVGVILTAIDGRSLFFEHLFGFLYWTSFLVVPGWLVALLVILWPRFDQLGRWVQLLIGALIGPLIMFSIGLYAGVASGTGFAYKVEAWRLVYLALAVSTLTSAIYVAALNIYLKKAHTQS